MINNVYLSMSAIFAMAVMVAVITQNTVLSVFGFYTIGMSFPIIASFVGCAIAVYMYLLYERNDDETSVDLSFQDEMTFAEYREKFQK